ncbi:MAG: hydrogenase formation protein HypD [Bacteroidales bacterium]|nr:hydrogenase formation protein HypD [Bacteroidales bacterium]
MKYIDEYRNPEIIKKLAEAIKKISSASYTFMEVCGGHTAAIQRFGIPALLPENIRLLSGPGCPVCVTSTDFIDKITKLSLEPGTIIATFGDLIRVPGSELSLDKCRSEGADIRIIFSPLEAVSIASVNPSRKVIFPGIGFETTAPGTAVAIKKAKEKGLRNFKVLSAHKIMPPAMEAIIRDGTRLNGFICPGHVSTIAGSKIFNFIPEKYGLGCVVSGFEPADILQSILMLVKQVNNNLPAVEIEYRRAVKPDGNETALRNMQEVFEICDSWWRGLGIIPASGLRIRKEYRDFDAEEAFTFETSSTDENPLCICGNILRGLATPSECPLFGKVCNNDNPVGACMVSAEGSCNIHLKYHPS